MAPNVERLLDTSVAVPFLLRSHSAHPATFAEFGQDTRLGLAGHAVFETISVLTRLPGNSRVSAATATHLVHQNFPASLHLSARASGGVLDRIARHGISGGAVYDALVAAAALEHGCALVTRDRRALPTYAAIGVEVIELI